jgi:hypothetical protein
MMTERGRWRAIAWQVLGFSAAALCGSLLVSVLQAQTARATSCTSPEYEEWIHLEKRGVESLGPADDPGDPSAVNAEWPDGGIMRALDRSLELDEPWGPTCHILEKLP